jgi:uncharacterized membrane protein
VAVSKPEERGLERLILFSDAIVAIAITLLVLPLTELEPREGQGVLPFLSEHREQLIAFAVSFAVIARFWFAHNSIFGRLARHNAGLRLLNSTWLASVVIMPFTTALMHFDDGYATLYLFNLLATAALTFALSAYLNAHPDLLLAAPTAAQVRNTRWSSWLLLAGIALALIGSIFLDQNGLWLLLLIPVGQALVNRRESQDSAVH